MKKPIKKLFFIGFCAVVSINIMGCNGCHHSQGTDNSTSSLPPISTPTSSPSKPTKALEDRVINSIQAGNLYDDMQQKIINVLKNLKKGEKNAMNNINRNTTLHGPILPVIVSAKVFANEDDEVQVIQFLGSIPGIELDKKDNEQETALGGAIENIRPKSVKALVGLEGEEVGVEIGGSEEVELSVPWL